MSATLTFQFGKHFLGDDAEAVVVAPFRPVLSALRCAEGSMPRARSFFASSLPLRASAKRNGRVDTERQRLLLAGEPVGQPPQLAASRLDE